jgi:PH domain
VLRPNLLSIYKNSEETKLRHQIDLSELTAVAFLKDRKQKRLHMFGLFSPSRNYHLQAPSEKEAHEWADLIRHEARIEEEEEEMFLASPGAQPGADKSFEKNMEEQRRWREERLGSSSPEPTGIRAITSMQSHSLDYSGNELGSYSDLSDSAAAGGVRGSSSLSLPQQEALHRSDTTRNLSQASGFDINQEEERVVWHGYLFSLSTKAKVRQWKKTWVVLRPKNLTFYKNDEVCSEIFPSSPLPKKKKTNPETNQVLLKIQEYSAQLIIPLSNIISAVEIDPISKSKSHCMELIAEEKRYRFCAPDEESLDKWLGALKSLLAKRKEADRKRAVAQQGAVIPPTPR